MNIEDTLKNELINLEKISRECTSAMWLYHKGVARGIGYGLRYTDVISAEAGEKYQQAIEEIDKQYYRRIAYANSLYHRRRS